MSRTGIPRGAWVFVILLLIATGLIVFGSRESESNPDSGSYRASGLRAFRGLLEKNGFTTRQSLSAIRPIAKDELAIAVFIASEVPNIGNDGWEKSFAMGPLFARHFRSGGRVLAVSVPADFRESSRSAMNAPTKATSTIDASTKSVSAASTNNYSDWNNFSFSEKDFVVWNTGTDQAFVWLDKVENGVLTGIANGLGMTNRFIDREDNAEVLLDAVRIAAGPHRKIVFLEAAHGMVSEVSLIEMIGPWATGAWWQLTIAFIVLILSLGVRFGLPEKRRLTQKGSREMADAMSYLFERAKATEVAMTSIVEDADRQIRKRLKISGDTPNDVRDRLLPDELAKALYHASNAAKERAPISAVLPVAHKLDQELAKFVGSQSRRPARRARR